MVSLISRQPDQYRSELEPDETKRVQSFEGMLSPVITRREQKGKGEGTEIQLTKVECGQVLIRLRRFIERSGELCPTLWFGAPAALEDHMSRTVAFVRGHGGR